MFISCCVYERIGDENVPELDVRYARQALPCGSSPLLVIGEDGAVARIAGQYFTEEEVGQFAAPYLS